MEKMRDKRELIQSYKAILPYLYRVYPDKDFAVRVLKALDSEKKEQELLVFLREFPKATLVDICEKMKELTDGRFSSGLGI